jgi:hypothetical protein
MSTFMPVDKLKAALGAVDWEKNIEAFLADPKASQAVATGNQRLAIWSHQLEIADSGNPALSFVREMQIAGQHVAVLIALSLYKPAAGSIRTVVETALYYSYFRKHPAELETLVRGIGFYIGKQDVVEFHKRHTVDFSDNQQTLGFLARLEKWYGQISSIVHGQVPDTWIEHKSVKDIKSIKVTQDAVVQSFSEAVELVHRLLLCTVGKHLWDAFTPSAKRALLAGLHGDIKKSLHLDSA